MKTLVAFKATIPASAIKAALAADRAADATTDALVAGLEQMPTGLGIDQDIRHLSGQVARQRALPRDASRDGRFLLHLEHALRDLAVRAPEAILWDSHGKINVNAGLTLAGQHYKLLELGSFTKANINGTIFGEDASVGQFFTVWSQANVELQGNVSFQGRFNAGRQGYVAALGVIRNLSGQAIPGSPAHVEPGGFIIAI